MLEIKTLKTDVVFLSFCYESKRFTRDMVFRRRSIIMANKDDHEKCLLTQI